MTTRHRHRVKHHTTVCWTHCVSARGWGCEEAHGCVTHVDTCRCGAQRKTESNGRRSYRGQWVERDRG
jgi:hypothetical protein